MFHIFSESALKSYISEPTLFSADYLQDFNPVSNTKPAEAINETIEGQNNYFVSKYGRAQPAESTENRTRVTEEKVADRNTKEMDSVVAVV